MQRVQGIKCVEVQDLTNILAETDVSDQLKSLKMMLPSGESILNIARTRHTGINEKLGFINIPSSYCMWSYKKQNQSGLGSKSKIIPPESPQL